MDYCLTTKSVEIPSVKVSPNTLNIIPIIYIIQVKRTIVLSVLIPNFHFSFVFMKMIFALFCWCLFFLVYVGLFSRVQAVRDHHSKDCRFLTFRRGEIIFVYHKLTGKRDDLWAGSVCLITYIFSCFCFYRCWSE